MSAFSRLQLAKALIEYDNENLPPDRRKDAEQSAIFMSLRRNLPSRAAVQHQARRSTDYLGVPLPSDAVENTSVGSRHSARKSLASVDALRNPFGRDSTHEGALEDDVEVDLSSWGLDALMDKDGKKKGKEVQRQPSDGRTVLPNPHERLQLQDTPGRKRPTANARTMSMGHIPLMGTGSQDQLDNFGVGGAFLDAKSTLPTATPPDLGPRRHSVGNPLKLSGVRVTDPALHRRRASEHALIDSIPITPPLHAVPFPQELGAAPDADVEEGGLAYDDEPGSSSAAKDTFAVPPPPPERASRFDPKVQRDRVVSTASLGTHMLSPSPDPGSPRPESALSGRPLQPGRDRPYSRIELMRPKVLIMPSPLQQSAPSGSKPTQVREGFELTTDGPPLPPEARTFGRSTASLLSPSHTGDGFTPNPRTSMTLSQLTFRNTLMVDGQRDVAFKDIEERLRWATQDGEQAALDVPNDSTPALPTMEITEAADMPRGKRPPGKLYGKSLIDDLEARKAEMKGKQRVFTGDQRPSMMARPSMQRSSTLIDPESLKRPASTMLPLVSSQSTPGLGPDGLTRRNSAHAKTLINFDDEIPGAPRGSFLAADNRGGGVSNTRSVFGVDTIWERELAKLREIEAREKAEEEERQKRGEGEDGKKKKGKSKRKGKGKEGDASPLETSSSMLSPSTSQVQDSPNTAAAASPETPSAPQRRVVRRPPPPPVDGDDEEEEEESDSSSVAGRPFGGPKTDGWHSGSEDEKRPQASQPRRATGSGSRFADNLPPRFRALQQQQQLELGEDESSEEDLPLVATIGRAAQRATRASFSGLRINTADESSDEEKPLVQLLEKTKQKLPSPTQGLGAGLFESIGASLGGSLHAGTAAGGGAAGGGGDEDEDDKPLGLRASRLFPGSQPASAAGGGDDDERPLALHPEQMRRSQFFASAAVQQQQQQQQMLMQAQAAAAAQMQMQQSMLFGAPSIMSAPFYAAPMAPPMMVPPQLPSTPPPMHDSAKLNRVDKWRHDVAVEGER